MLYWLSIILAFIVGYFISVQGVFNSIGSKLIGGPALVAWLSLVQLIPPLVYILIKSPAVGLTQSLSIGFKWYFVSGILGIIIVSSLSWSIGNVGALTVFVLVVLGQIIGSALADQFGMFGSPIKPLNTLRLVSIGIIVAGVLLLVRSEQLDQAKKDNDDIKSPVSVEGKPRI
jgi:transporter family-2 protein